MNKRRNEWNRALDALAAWVGRGIDWDYFAADTHALVAEIFRRQRKKEAA